MTAVGDKYGVFSLKIKTNAGGYCLLPDAHMDESGYYTLSEQVHRLLVESSGSQHPLEQLD